MSDSGLILGTAYGTLNFAKKKPWYAEEEISPKYTVDGPKPQKYHNLIFITEYSISIYLPTYIFIYLFMF